MAETKTGEVTQTQPEDDKNNNAKCTTLDCQDEIWDIISPEIAYCCGYRQTKILSVFLLIIILFYMVYTYYTTRTISVGQGIFLGLVICAFFILPDLAGKSTRSQWMDYSRRMDHLMNVNPGMTLIDARADISRDELAKRTQREIKKLLDRDRYRDQNR